MVPLAWKARTIPLAPGAVLAQGPAARRLAHQLLGWHESRLAQVRACAGPELLLVLGEESVLPWVDGGCYLGHDPDAPSLLVPTNLTPGVPVDLFAQALAARTGAGPWAMVPEGAGSTVVAVATAAPVSRDRLAAWIEEQP